MKSPGKIAIYTGDDDDVTEGEGRGRGIDAWEAARRALDQLADNALNEGSRMAFC